jgi:hypothetical protein
MHVWGNVLVPDTLWSARINDAAILRGETSIAFDGGSGSDYTLVSGGQEVWVGTSAGAKDIGRLRIRSISSGDGGVTGTLTAAQHPWILEDDHYLTFKFDYAIRQKFPFIESDGTFKKDKDIAYTDENSQPKPVCVCGTDRAGWLDPTSGNIIFNVDASTSYAVTEGASISSYSLTVLPAAGSSTAFDTSTGVGTVTFTTTGQRWLKFTVTDSNAKTQVTYRCYWVNDPDPGGADHPMFEFTGVRLNGDWDRGGWSSFFQVHNDATLTDIPDEARILLWSENSYDTDVRAITLLPFNNVETIFNGYLMRDNTQQDLKTGGGLVTFEMFTPQEMLRRFNLGVSLEVVQGTPDTWWKYEEWLTVGRGIHHLWKHHSTLFGCWDVIGLMDNTIPRMHTLFEEGDLYSMPDTLAFQNGIRAHVVCDVGGRVHLTQDLQLLTDEERDLKKTIFDMTMDDLSGQIELRREPLNKAAFVKISGFGWDGSTFITDENNEIVPDGQPYCASAPGLMPAYEGETIHMMERQTFVDQIHCNKVAGRVYAQQNNEYRPLSMTFHGNYYGVFDVAYDNWYSMSLQAGDTERGIIWTDKRMACRSVSMSIDTKKGSAQVNAIFEVEMAAEVGEPAYCLDEMPDYGGEIPSIVTDDSPDGIITGSPGFSIYFKSGEGKTWSQRSTQTVRDLIMDPFWQSKQSSTASNDSILLKCNTGFVRRSTDGGQNWSDITPSTNPPNTNGDSPAPTATTVTYHRGEGNWIYLDEFVVLVRWQNSSSVWRSWLAYTDDNGATWSWQSIGTTCKVIGISTGKGAGDRVYVTGWNGSALILYDYDLPALTLNDSHNLGAATLAQINDGTYFANPFAGTGDDDWVIVYGRMLNPYSLGDPTYVLESDDGGVTASLVQTDNTWTTGYCSALWMEPDGLMYAIRKIDSAASKLYYGNATVNLNLMSTLPFTDGVNPHALRVKPSTLAVYVAADTGQSVMVAKSQVPYTSWTDITYDHGTSFSVKSLELL